MHAKVRLLGHPVHQMLIVLPLGLLAGVVIFDILHLTRGEDQWATIAYWLIPVGVIAGLVAAVFGLIDWTAIPAGSRAKRIGVMHASANVMALVLFIVSGLMRRGEPADPSWAAMVVAWVGALTAGLGGWLGGELVDRLGVGVDEGAHVDAPNSLTHGSATSHAPVGRG